MSLYSEKLVLKYRKGDTLSISIIGELDSSAATIILIAAMDKNYDLVRTMKDNFNFNCIVIENDVEYII